MAEDTKKNKLTPDEVPELTKAQIADLVKSKAGYMIIDFNFNKVVLPYEEGLAVMAGLKNAEASDYNSMGSFRIIKPLSGSAIESTLISHQVYLDRKMSHLFGIEIDNT